MRLIILIGPVFQVLLTNEHFLTYNQNDRFAFVSGHKIKAIVQVLRF